MPIPFNKNDNNNEVQVKQISCLRMFLKDLQTTINFSNNYI